MLQWVHRPRTVVMLVDPRLAVNAEPGFNGSTVRERWLWHGPGTVSDAEFTASMGPPSENGGYVVGRGQRAAVLPASMGPPSENGGYASIRSLPVPPFWRFNGSTVRERWLCRSGS